MSKSNTLLLLGCLLLAACTAKIINTVPPPATPDQATLTNTTPSPLPAPTAALAATTTLIAATISNPGPPPPTSLPQPHIFYFKASPPLVRPGEHATLVWQSTGLEAYITTLGPFGTMPNHQIPVPLSGTLVITTSKNHYNSVGYHLSVSFGGTFTTADVYIKLACQYEWFFDAAHEVCPHDPVLHSAAAEQHFERGVMIWVAELDQIIVLYADNQIPKLAVLTDEWDEGQPEQDPNITPPPGLYQPTRGFGLLWREHARERLGYATDQEAGFDTSLQTTSMPKYNSTYLLGLDGRVWHLGPERSSWEKMP